MKTEMPHDTRHIRSLESTLAGAWYPGSAKALDTLITRCLDNVPEPSAGAGTNVLILPHAGYDYSAQTAAYGIKRIQGAEFKRVVLLAPSHHFHISNRLIAPESGAVSTPYGTIEIDQDAIDTVSRKFQVSRSDAVHQNEHSTQIQYPMLQFALNHFKIVPFVIGTMDRHSIAKAASALRTVLDSETLLVVSSDFTHYGDDFDYAPFEKKARENVARLDSKAYETINNIDLDGFLSHIESTGATICGRTPIAVMLALLPRNAELEMAHYETSSDESGDFSRFVCYMCVAGHADWILPAKNTQDTTENFLTDEDKRLLLRFARSAIRHKLDTGKTLPADSFENEASENMRQRMGCFVTLKMKTDHSLRGCIGEIIAQRPLYQAVTDLAVHSAFQDSRFRELRQEEFDQITLEISALTPEHPVASWQDIDIGKHGMTVSKHGRMAVFLPQVAPEQGWTLEETLTHLSLKAGLRSDDWRHGAEFTVFEAIVFNEAVVD